jgi:hypothetical protein
MSDRITAYAIQADGTRAYQVRVNGVRILLTAQEGQHNAAMELAGIISGIGPAEAPESEPAQIDQTTSVLQVRKQRPDFVVGQRVWCNVHGSEGYCTITEVGTGRNRGRVKITGMRAWCPACNFDLDKA